MTACHTPADCLAEVERMIAAASPQPWAADNEAVYSGNERHPRVVLMDEDAKIEDLRLAALGARMVGPLVNDVVGGVCWCSPPSGYVCTGCQRAAGLHTALHELGAWEDEG